MRKIVLLALLFFPSLPAQLVYTTTPVLGWNSWSAWRGSPTDTAIRNTAAGMVYYGLPALGYTYVTIDDGWMAASRDGGGNLVADATKFPNGMAAVGTYIHGLGLKFGLYLASGTTTCQGLPGSYQHETADAALFASWGVDLLKYDLSCGTRPLPQATEISLMAAAITAAGRPMVLTTGIGDSTSASVFAAAGANSGRICGDMTGGWATLLPAFTCESGFTQYGGVGHWLDLDSPETGLGFLTDTEGKTNMTLWAMQATPINIGADVRQGSASGATITTLSDTDVIAVDQDALGINGLLVSSIACGSATCQVWAKPMVGTNTCAVALFNLDSAAHDITALFSSIAATFPACGTGPYTTTRDLWAHSSLGTLTTSYTATAVPSHGASMVKLIGLLADVWVTQSGSGTQDGTSLPNAAPVAYLSTSTNCGTVGPDTTIHLSGAFTFTAGTAGIRFDQMACSGTSGHSITIKFETGAVLQSPYFTNGAGSPVGAGLNIHGLQYIVVDGGTACGTVAGAVDSGVSCNGIIRNTANGTAYTNHSQTMLLEASTCTPGCEVKNLGLGPAYLRASNCTVSVSCSSGTCTATGSQIVGTGAKVAIVGSVGCSISHTSPVTVTSGGTTWAFTLGSATCSETGLTAVDESTNQGGSDVANYSILNANPANGLKVHDSIFHDGGWLVNVNGTAVQFYNNQVYYMDHGFANSPLGNNVAGPIIHDNHFHDMVNWDDNTATNNNHHDAVHLLLDTANNPQWYYANYYEYNNRFDGDAGQPNEWSFNRASSVSSAVFNNVFGCNPARSFPDMFSPGDDSFTTGSQTLNAVIANNTFTCVGSWTTGGTGFKMPSATNGTGTVTGTVIKNNIFQGQQFVVSMGDFSTGYFASGGIDYNIYEKNYSDSGNHTGTWPLGKPGYVTHCIDDARCDGSQGSSPNNWCWGSATGTFCQHAILPTGSGQDAHTQLLTNAAMLLNSNGSLQISAPSVGAGTNLASLCISNGGSLPDSLCSDISGVARPASGAWDIGAYQYAVGTTPTSRWTGSFVVSGK